MVVDYINTMKTTFNNNAFIPNNHFSNSKFTSKQRLSISAGLVVINMKIESFLHCIDIYDRRLY